MGGLFSKKKKDEGGKTRVTEQDRAVLQLKQQRDKLKQYTRRIEAQLERERQVAKQLLKDGKRDKAKLLLRKKKFLEGTIVKTEGQLENIDRLVQDLEFAQVEAQVLQGLQRGNESLKAMHRLMSIEDVERIMDETQESVEYQREIDDLLSGQLTAQDEDDVMAELLQITEESEGAADISLPDVPTHIPEGEREGQREATKKEGRVALEA